MSQQIAYLAVSGLYILITLLFVANRLYVRILSRGEALSTHSAATASDGLVIVAWLFKVAQTACDVVVYTKHALNDEPADLDPQSLKTFQEWYCIETALFYVPLYCIKAAILFYLLEITPSLLKRIRSLIYGGLVLTIVGFIATPFVYLFSCGPATVDFWWSRNYRWGVCKTATITMPCSVFYHVMTDAYIYTIPFLILGKLRIISLGQKIATGAMFGAGFLLICLGIGTAAPVRGMWGFWWGLHEQSFAIAVACLPSLRITFLRWCGERRRSIGGSSTDSSGKPSKSLAKKLMRGELTTREVGEGFDIEVKEPIVEAGDEIDFNRTETSAWQMKVAVSSV